jgi:hypothetical protein
VHLAELFHLRQKNKKNATKAGKTQNNFRYYHKIKRKTFNLLVLSPKTTIFLGFFHVAETCSWAMTLGALNGGLTLLYVQYSSKYLFHV